MVLILHKCGTFILHSIYLGISKCFALELWPLSMEIENRAPENDKLRVSLNQP